jgi:hypothetical protein
MAITAPGRNHNTPDGIWARAAGGQADAGFENRDGNRTRTDATVAGDTAGQWPSPRRAAISPLSQTTTPAATAAAKATVKVRSPVDLTPE